MSHKDNIDAHVLEEVRRRLAKHDRWRLGIVTEAELKHGYGIDFVSGKLSDAEYQANADREDAEDADDDPT